MPVRRTRHGHLKGVSWATISLSTHCKYMFLTDSDRGKSPLGPCSWLLTLKPQQLSTLIERAVGFFAIHKKRRVLPILVLYNRLHTCKSCLVTAVLIKDGTGRHAFCCLALGFFPVTKANFWFSFVPDFIQGLWGPPKILPFFPRTWGSVYHAHSPLFYSHNNIERWITMREFDWPKITQKALWLRGDLNPGLCDLTLTPQPQESLDRKKGEVIDSLASEVRF